MKNCSLLASDFQAGELPAGPQGAQGPADAPNEALARVTAAGDLVAGSGATAVDSDCGRPLKRAFNQVVSGCAWVSSMDLRASGVMAGEFMSTTAPVKRNEVRS